MAKIVKIVPLFNEASATRTGATTYAAPANRRRFLYTSGNYDGSLTVYFEAVLKTSNATYAGRARLYTSGGTAVSGILSTTSLTPVRLRSASFSLTDGTMYEVRISPANTSATVTLYSARLIIIQNGTLTKTETTIELGNNVATTSSASYVDGTNTGRFLWRSNEWSGTVTCYLEAIIKTNNASYAAYVVITDEANNVVAEVSTAVTTDGNRVRSGSFSLVHGTTYKIRFRNVSASYTTTLASAAVIVIQTITLNKTLSPYPIRSTQHTTASLTGTSLYGYILWTNGDWDVAKKIFHQVTMMISNAAYVASAMLNDGSDRDTRTTQVTSKTILRSPELSLTDGNTFDTQIKVSDVAGTNTMSGSMLLVSMVDYQVVVVGKITIAGAVVTENSSIYTKLIFTHGWFVPVRQSDVFTLGWFPYIEIATATYVALGKVQVSGLASFLYLPSFAYIGTGKIQLLATTGTVGASVWPVLFAHGWFAYLRSVTVREVFTHGWFGSSLVTWDGSGKINLSGHSLTSRHLDSYIYASSGEVTISGAIGITYEWEIDDIMIQKPAPFVYVGVGKTWMMGYAPTIGERHYVDYPIEGQVSLSGAVGGTIDVAYESSGGTVVSGSVESSFTWDHTSVVSGEIVLSGVASLVHIKNFVYSYLAGKVEVKGIASTNRSIIKLYSGSGKITIFGTPFTGKFQDYRPIGKVLLFGSSSSSELNVYVCSGAGKVELEGVAESEVIIAYVGSGKVGFSGIGVTAVTVKSAYIPIGKINLSGIGSVMGEGFEFIYSPDGKIVLIVEDVETGAILHQWFSIAEWYCPV